MARALLYGATGYTGRLIAEMAPSYGVHLIVAGRDARAVAALADELQLEGRAFSLTEPKAIRSAIHDVQVVLNCAGPFIHTFEPLAAACIASGVHYVDVTGEIVVIEALAARGAAARAAGVMLLPGAGFDVVPTDCLAVYLKGKLPTAHSLALAIRGTGLLSRGTKTTMVEHLHRGGMVRREGRITRVPAGWKTRSIDFGDGHPYTAITIPWGDVATAYYSTGIPNIEVYAALPVVMRRTLKLSRYFGWLTRLAAIRALLRRRVRAGAPGPTVDERAHARSFVWGEAEDAHGNSVVARLSGPDGYTMTAHTALLIIRRVLQGNAPPGFQTPARAYGPDLVLEVPGVTRTE